MRLKSLCVGFLLCFLMALVTACSGGNENPTPSNQTKSDYPKEIISLARIESINLGTTLSILEQVESNYSKWEQGEVTRESLAEQLVPLYQEVNKIQDDYLKFCKDTDFNKSPAADHEAYQGGLYQGEMVRKRIMRFIRDTSAGYPAAEGVFPANAPKMDDSSLKQSYESHIASNIDKRISNLQVTLSEFEEKGLLK